MERQVTNDQLAGRKASFSIKVSADELDMLKEDAESLAQSDEPAIAALGKRMCQAVKRTAKRMGFRYKPV